AGRHLAVALGDVGDLGVALGLRLGDGRTGDRVPADVRGDADRHVELVAAQHRVLAGGRLALALGDVGDVGVARAAGGLGLAQQSSGVPAHVHRNGNGDVELVAPCNAELAVGGVSVRHPGTDRKETGRYESNAPRVPRPLVHRVSL